jgi:hypothetical protein
MRGEDANETTELTKALKEARAFIQSFRWCTGIKRDFFGYGIGGVLSVFLFQIERASEDVDEWLWVITGDLPPAYIVASDNPNPACALQAYCLEMRRWVDAAKQGKEVAELIPVNASPTLDNASALEKRVRFIESAILAGGPPKDLR